MTASANPSQPEPLLVVDVQRAFMNEFTRHIPRRIRHVVESGNYAPVLFTRFINSSGSPYRRLLGWHASAGPPETDVVDELAEFATPDTLFDKHGLTGMPDSLSNRLRSE